MAHLHFKDQNVQIRWIPFRLHQIVRTTDLNDVMTLFLLDCVGPNNLALMAAEAGIDVFVLDHHVTNLRALEDLEHPRIDITHSCHLKSGVRIAYDYFKPALDESMLRMMDMVEDVDIWRNMDRPDRKAFNLGMNDIQFQRRLEFDVRVNPLIFDQLMQINVEDVLSVGYPLLIHTESRIQFYLQEKVFEIMFKDTSPSGRCLAVVLAYQDSFLYSEIGNALAAFSETKGLLDIGAVIKPKKDLFIVSLRSLRTDTSFISQRFGGGGHACASSFCMSKKRFDKLTVNR